MEEETDEQEHACINMWQWTRHYGRLLC